MSTYAWRVCAEGVIERAREEAEDGGAQEYREHGLVGPCGRLVVHEVHRWEREEERHEQHGSAQMAVNVHCE